MLIELIVPNPETTAVPPADTNGWYPNPSVEPTETITPPKGTFELLGSEVTDAIDPVNWILVIPTLPSIRV